MAKGIKIILGKSNGRTIDDVRSWEREAENERKRRLIELRPYNHWFNTDGSLKTTEEAAQAKRKEEQ